MWASVKKSLAFEEIAQICFVFLILSIKTKLGATCIAALTLILNYENSLSVVAEIIITHLATFWLTGRI